MDNQRTSEIVYLRCHELWIRSDGITQIRILPNADVTLKDAEEVVKAIYDINQRQRKPLLVDMSEIGSMDKRARMLYTAEERSLNSIAILIKSPISKIVGNFFIGLNKLLVPTKLCTREDEAVDWLKGYL